MKPNLSIQNRMIVAATRFQNEVKESGIALLQSEASYLLFESNFSRYQDSLGSTEYRDVMKDHKDSVEKRNAQYTEWLDFLRGNRRSVDAALGDAVNQLLGLVDVMPRSIQWCKYEDSTGLLHKIMRNLEGEGMQALIKAAKSETNYQKLKEAIAKEAEVKSRKTAWMVHENKESSRLMEQNLRSSMMVFNRFVRIQAKSSAKEEWQKLAAVLESVLRDLRKKQKAQTASPDSSSEDATAETNKTAVQATA